MVLGKKSRNAVSETGTSASEGVRRTVAQDWAGGEHGEREGLHGDGKAAGMLFGYDDEYEQQNERVFLDYEYLRLYTSPLGLPTDKPSPKGGLQTCRSLPYLTV